MRFPGTAGILPQLFKGFRYGLSEMKNGNVLIMSPEGAPYSSQGQRPWKVKPDIEPCQGDLAAGI